MVEEEKQPDPAPYNDASFYVKACKNCHRIVFVDVANCPECGGNEFGIVDMTGGD